MIGIPSSLLVHIHYTDERLTNMVLRVRSVLLTVHGEHTPSSRTLLFNYKNNTEKFFLSALSIE